MGCYSAMQKSKELICATTWLNIKDIVSGRSHMQKTTCCVDPFICHELLQIKKIIRKFHPLRLRFFCVCLIIFLFSNFIFRDCVNFL